MPLFPALGKRASLEVDKLAPFVLEGFADEALADGGGGVARWLLVGGAAMIAGGALAFRARSRAKARPTSAAAPASDGGAG